MVKPYAIRTENICTPWQTRKIESGQQDTGHSQWAPVNAKRKDQTLIKVACPDILLVTVSTNLRIKGPKSAWNLTLTTVQVLPRSNGSQATQVSRIQIHLELLKEVSNRLHCARCLQGASTIQFQTMGAHLYQISANPTNHHPTVVLVAECHKKETRLR